MPCVEHTEEGCRRKHSSLRKIGCLSIYGTYFLLASMFNIAAAQPWSHTLLVCRSSQLRVRTYIEVLIRSEFRNLTEHCRTLNTVEMWPATEM